MIRVTAEKTLGRVGIFFFGLCDGSHAFAMAIVFKYILLTIHCLFVSENANNSTMLTSKTHLHSVIEPSIHLTNGSSNRACQSLSIHINSDFFTFLGTVPIPVQLEKFRCFSSNWEKWNL